MSSVTVSEGFLQRARDALSQNESIGIYVWAAALLFYVVGDASTTIVSMSLGGVEANPVALYFMALLGPTVGLFVNKLLVTAFCIVLYRFYPDPFGVGRDPFRLAIPVVMIIHGCWITAHNLSIIATL